MDSVVVNDRVQLQATKTATALTANRIGDTGPGKYLRPTDAGHGTQRQW